MSARPANVESTAIDVAEEIVVSADSHIMEPTDLWVNNLPPAFKGKYPEFPPRNSIGEKPGGSDPEARVEEMSVDGVSAEVLYPTLGLRLFALEDAELQEACFEIANDWLIDYCKVHPDRLVGVPSVSLYNVDNAIKELERCKKAGLVGCLIWQVPPRQARLRDRYISPPHSA